VLVSHGTMEYSEAGLNKRCTPVVLTAVLHEFTMVALHRWEQFPAEPGLTAGCWILNSFDFTITALRPHFAIDEFPRSKTIDIGTSPGAGY